MNKNAKFDLCCYDDKYNGLRLPFMKALAIMACADKVENLVLGSSHGGYGYIPQPNEFNLCFPSEDLYYSNALYRKYKNKLSNLQNIILFYSIFSPGSSLIKSSENWRCCHYKMAFGINSPSKDFDKLIELQTELIKKQKDYFEIANIKPKTDYRGANIDLKGKAMTPIKNVAALRKRVLSHIKCNLRNHDQNKYLKKLIEVGHKDGRNVFIVISPLRKEFRDYLANYEVLFDDLLKITKEYKVRILNFFEDKRFKAEDFFDYDHLNLAGAEKLTNYIRKEIYS